jgi:SAM-dependent methyltransferase
VGRGADPAWLRHQYGDGEKLRIRQQTHARYAEKREEPFQHWVLRQLAPRPGERILDAGCGHGAYHGALAESGASVVGLDASPGMLREAIESAEADGRDVAVAAGSLESLPFAAARFEGAMANHVLYHVSDRARALAELARVLRPGGRAVLATNGAEFVHELWGLHGEAAASLGLAADRLVSESFTLDCLDLVRRAFPAARVLERRNRLVFPEPEGALRYYASGMVDLIAGERPDADRREALLRAVASRVGQAIAREGAFRVTTVAGCYVCPR